MYRGRSRASADDGGEVAVVLEREGEFQVELGVGDGGEAETSLAGIVQVRADVGEVDERHLEKRFGPGACGVRRTGIK